MADVTCTRCGQTREALESAPYPDDMGQEIFDKICATCWHECKEILEKSTREFLGLTPLKSD
jgi:Fe-S cluster biosynthesis and repair protein YggX